MPRRFFFRLISAATPAGDHVSDTDLLRRFVHDRDSAAFELLVRRHADAVWTACRRVLRCEADAEDAFQATFLVLARKAGSVRGACVGGWLFRVAVHAALKLKASRARQGEPRPPESGEGGPLPGGRGSPDEIVESAELAAVVQEELARLPERYRLPVVLCDLEGHTHAEAAAALNWPVGSVSGRLSRAHGILRDRLSRRGVAAPAVLLPVGGLSATVVRDSTAAAVGTVAVPPSVSILVQGVLSAMRTAKLKLTAVVLASAGLLGVAGVGTVTVLGQPPASGEVADPGRTPTAPGKEGQRTTTAAGDSITAFPELDPKGMEDLVEKCPKLFAKDGVPILPKDDALRQLQKARLNAATRELWRNVEGINIGRQDRSMTTAIPEITNRAVAAVNDFIVDPRELRPWYEERVRVAKWYELTIAARIKVGAETVAALERARFARLDAEIALLKLDRQAVIGVGR